MNDRDPMIDVDQTRDITIGKHGLGSMPVATLDLGDVGCPLLGLKSMKALNRLKSGQTMEITTRHPGARKALGRVSWMTRSRLIAAFEDNGRFTYVLRRA